MDIKVCFACKKKLPLTEYQSNGKSSAGTPRVKPRCKSCNATYETGLFQEKLERILGKEVDWKCKCCGYNKCISALEFHHRDPITKERPIAIMKNYKEETLRREVDKCVLLCANCHREFHDGLITIPE